MPSMNRCGTFIPTELPRSAAKRISAVVSPPDGGVDRFELLDGPRPELGGQVLRAVVDHEENDVALVQLVGHPHGDSCDRTGGDAGEDALLEEELLRPYDRVAVRHENLPVEQREVDDRRDEPVVERA